MIDIYRYIKPKKVDNSYPRGEYWVQRISVVNSGPKANLTPKLYTRMYAYRVNSYCLNLCAAKRHHRLRRQLSGNNEYPHPAVRVAAP